MRPAPSGVGRGPDRRAALTLAAAGVTSLALPASPVHASPIGPLASPSSLVLALDAGDPASYSAGSSTWNDQSGAGNHVTLQSGATAPTHDAGGWLAFDRASGQYLDVPAAVVDGIIAGGRAYTKEAWVRFPSGSADGPYNVLSTPSDVLYLRQVTGVITLYGTPGGSPYTATTASAGTLIPDRWHHVAFASNGSNVHRLFVDGALVSTGTNTRAFVGGPLRIGAHALADTSPTSFWQGRIAQVRVYATALSDADVLGNFTVTRGRYGV